jgi:hypothetical protein
MAEKAEGAATDATTNTAICMDKPVAAVCSASVVTEAETAALRVAFPAAAAGEAAADGTVAEEADPEYRRRPIPALAAVVVAARRTSNRRL